MAAVEPHAISRRITRDYEVQDGLGVLYVRIGRGLTARLVSTALVAKLHPDLVRDGAVTAGDCWLARQIAAPSDGMLLSSARRLLYEVVPKTTWLGRDHLGSAVVAVDEAGLIVGRRAFAPFGARFFSSGDSDRRGFTGQDEAATGLQRFGFRDLDPTVGRWTSRDPLFASADARRLARLGESTTAYAYVANDPANAVDPTGLVKETGQALERTVSALKLIATKSNPARKLSPCGNCSNAAQTTIQNLRKYLAARARGDDFTELDLELANIAFEARSRTEVENHFERLYVTVKSFEEMGRALDSLEPGGQLLFSVEGPRGRHALNGVKIGDNSFFIDSTWQEVHTNWRDLEASMNAEGLAPFGYLIVPKDKPPIPDSMYP